MRYMALPPFKADLTSSPISVTQPYSTSSYASINSAFDEMGNLLFYVQDDNVYNSSGGAVAALPLINNWNQKLPSSLIVPVPGQCRKFYYIYCRTTSPTGVAVGYVIIDCSMGISVTGQSINAAFPIGNSSGNHAAVACSKKIGTGSSATYNLYACLGGVVRHSVISNTGISSSTFVYANLNAGSECPTELELSENGQWLAYNNILSNPSAVVLQLSSPNSFLGGSDHRYTNIVPKGIEFFGSSTPDLYVAGPSLFSKINVGTYAITTLNSSPYSLSSTHLELYNGNICGVGNSGTNKYLVQFNPGTQVLSATAVNGIGYTAGFAPVQNALMAQIDGEDYSNFTTIPLPNPTITGNIYFCMGDPLGFAGSAGAGVNATSHQWTLIECTAAGKPIPNVSWTSGAISGNPGNFAFPPGLAIVGCVRYYLVQLTVTNQCGKTATVQKIINVRCTPTASLPRNIAVCKGVCTWLYVNNPNTSYTYDWFIMGDEPIYVASGEMVMICPQQTTNYYVTVTDPLTGCHSNIITTVIVDVVNPNFSVSQNPNSPSYLELAATPIQLTNLPSTFQYTWKVEELDQNMNTVFQAYNPLCWQNFPNQPTNHFEGFQGLTPVFNTNCAPNPGQFKYGTSYKITRSVWSDLCPEVAASATVSYEYGGRYSGSVESIPTITSSNNGDAFGSFASGQSLNVLAVYPNPAEAKATVELSPNDLPGILKMIDLQGRVLKEMSVEPGSQAVEIDVRNFEDGIYILYLFGGDKKSRPYKIQVTH